MIWKMVPICLFWCVWKERNNRCFKDLERSMKDILAFVFSYFVSLDGCFCVPLLSYVDFLCSCFPF
jgi:hypothetical protein